MVEMHMREHNRIDLLGGEATERQLLLQPFFRPLHQAEGIGDLGRPVAGHGIGMAAGIKQNIAPRRLNEETEHGQADGAAAACDNAGGLRLQIAGIQNR